MKYSDFDCYIFKNRHPNWELKSDDEKEFEIDVRLKLDFCIFSLVNHSNFGLFSLNHYSPPMFDRITIYTLQIWKATFTYLLNFAKTSSYIYIFFIELLKRLKLLKPNNINPKILLIIYFTLIHINLN